jgi:membrane protease YdiL (CAAX protease family)
VSEKTHHDAAAICLFVMAFFAIWSLRATLLYSIDESFAAGLPRTAYATAVKLLLWCGLGAGFVVLVRRENPLHYCGLTTAVDARVFAKCLALTLAFVTAILGVELTLGGKGFNAAALLDIIGASGFLMFFVSPAVEEFMFRGLILKEIARLTANATANILTSLLFVGIHLPFWLYYGGLTDVVVANAVGVFIFSMVAGWFYLKSGSVWPAVVVHIANNIVAAGLVP